MDHLHRLHHSAARAAGRDFLEGRGLAAPDLDPTRTGDVIAARAAEELGDGANETLAHTWARHYVGALEALRTPDVGERLADLQQIEDRGFV